MNNNTLANMIIHQMMVICYQNEKNSKKFSEYADHTLEFLTKSLRSKRIYRSNKPKH